MLSFRFKRNFDAEIIASLYQELRGQDSGVTLILRSPSGQKVDDADKAGIGEIRGADGKGIFLMNAKEGVVYLNRAGALKAPLMEFLKRKGFGQEEVEADLAIVCVVIFIALEAFFGFYYSASAHLSFLYPVILICLGLVLFGLFLLSFSSKPGREVWGVPAMAILFLGALPTVPACFLVNPMIKVLERKKLQCYLRQ
ncbi:hypothetical protein [Billgrantia sp. C5P2]|uniref:hypothetical protein n=1 Tax=Billgrantia sp. C5P2 TaxID=3436239 RepID=UPI003DA4A274